MNGVESVCEDVVYIVSNGARVLLLSGGQVGRIRFLCDCIKACVCVCVCRSLINSAQTQNGPLEGENGERSNNIFTEEIDGWSIARASLDTSSLTLSLTASNNSIFLICYSTYSNCGSEKVLGETSELKCRPGSP